MGMSSENFMSVISCLSSWPRIGVEGVLLISGSEDGGANHLISTYCPIMERNKYYLAKNERKNQVL